MLHGFASPVQKTDSFLQPAIFDPINIRLPAFKQIAENSGLVYLSRRTLINFNKNHPGLRLAWLLQIWSFSGCWRLAVGALDGRLALVFRSSLPHFSRVTTKEAVELLEKFRAGGIGRDEVVRAFQAAPVADLGFAQVDTHRALRKGFPEVIFGAGKTPQQVLKIASKLLEREQRILVTRVTSEHARVLRK